MQTVGFSSKPYAPFLIGEYRDAILIGHTIFRAEMVIGPVSESPQAARCGEPDVISTVCETRIHGFKRPRRFVRRECTVRQTVDAAVRDEPEYPGPVFNDVLHPVFQESI